MAADGHGFRVREQLCKQKNIYLTCCCKNQLPLQTSAFAGFGTVSARAIRKVEVKLVRAQVDVKDIGIRLTCRIQ